MKRFLGIKLKPRVQSLLSNAQKKTRRTKTDIAMQCLEIGLPLIIGGKKATTRKQSQCGIKR
jgi:hypothetical protein